MDHAHPASMRIQACSVVQRWIGWRGEPRPAPLHLLPMIEPEPPAPEPPPSTGERLPAPSRPGTGLGEAIRDLIGGVLGN